MVTGVFDKCVEYAKEQGVEEEDMIKLKVASAHWLRHTGISRDVKTRPLAHVRDDSGHANIQILDIY